VLGVRSQTCRFFRLGSENLRPETLTMATVATTTAEKVTAEKPTAEKKPTTDEKTERKPQRARVDDDSRFFVEPPMSRSAMRSVSF